MNILVTSKSFGKTNPAAWARLEKSGFSLRRFAGGAPTPGGIASQIAGVGVLIVGNDTVDQTVLDAADSLRLIHMNGTGLDGIDVAGVTARGILVANAPGANRNAVAELTVALMLNAGRGVERHARLLREGRWERTPGRELSGATVGILGLGNIGRRVVELLRGFSPQFVLYDPLAASAPGLPADAHMAAHPDEVFAAADYLVLTLPLTPETRHLVDDRTLGLMKPTAFLVNTARGGLVDDGALCRAVAGGRLAGAALDVFAEEPPPMDSPLRGVPEIMLTPHLAATSVESAARVSDIVADNIIDILIKGQRNIAVNFTT